MNRNSDVLMDLLFDTLVENKELTRKCSAQSNSIELLEEKLQGLSQRGRTINYFDEDNAELAYGKKYTPKDSAIKDFTERFLKG